MRLAARCALVLLGSLVWGPLLPAGAAGAASAEITGPGIDRPIDLLPQAPDLPALTGAWFAARAEDVTPLMDQPPTTQLGQRLVLTWVMLGPPQLPPDQRAIIQYVYPEAEGGALVETPDGQDIWSGAVGWYAAPEEFRHLLARAGIVPRHNSPWRKIGTGALAGAATLIGLTLVAKRRQTTHARIA